MEEKKLTDEEIVRIFEHCANNNDCEKCSCFYTEDKITGRFCHFETMDIDIKLLDLIHRLQAENETLKSHMKAKEIADEHVRKMRGTDLRTIAELQKQVDDLKEQFLSTCENCHLKKDIELLRYQKEQAVKDTAQEALEAFICKLVNSRLVSTKDDLYVEMLETKDDLLKECYGVEVE